MSRIRVLHFISGVAVGDQSGGAEFHALQVARYLDKEIFEPRICAAWRYGSSSEIHWLEQLSSDCIPVDGLSAFPGTQRPKLRMLIPTLWSAVNGFRPHIVHSHSERYDSVNSMVRMLHPARPRAVRTIHLDRQWQSRPRLGPIVSSYLFPYIFHYEIGVSQAIYDQLKGSSRRKESKIGLCYNGIDASAFEGQASGKGGEFEDVRLLNKPRIGIVARITEQKGHQDLLEAFKLVIQRQKASLLVVGDGPLRSELEEKTKTLAISDDVRFLGTQTSVWETLPPLDLFVLPSYWEGFPTVILEAMWQGIPVIASDIPGNRELVRNGESGLLFQPGDVRQLAEVLYWALDNSESMAAMARGAKELASKYTIQNTVQCYAQIYKYLMK